LSKNYIAGTNRGERYQIKKRKIIYTRRRLGALSDGRELIAGGGKEEKGLSR